MDAGSLMFFGVETANGFDPSHTAIVTSGSGESAKIAANCGNAWNGSAHYYHNWDEWDFAYIIKPGGYEKRAVISDNREIPEGEVFQVYPNPFNLRTRIQYRLSESTPVSIKIYDILGRLVRNLVNYERTSGLYSTFWDGTNDDGIVLSSGVYIINITTRQFTRSTRTMLIK